MGALRRGGGVKARVGVARRALSVVEATTRVIRQYKEEEAAAKGELRWYGVGIWMRSLEKRQLPLIETALGFKAGSGRRGWWDANPPHRDCWFFAMGVEASSPERALLRCLDHLTHKFEEQGVSSPTALRIEAEPLPDDYEPEKTGEEKE